MKKGVALMSLLYKPENDGFTLRQFPGIRCYRHDPGGA
jgi:hypothetical protein